MKHIFIPFFLLLMWSSVSAQTAGADTLLFAPLTQTYSASTYGSTGSFVLTYPSEITVFWNRWAAIGAQVDTLWFERYDVGSASWQKLRFYKEQTGDYDTLLVKDRPVSIINPIHAVPVHVRINTGGRQTDTVKVQWRRQ